MDLIAMAMEDEDTVMGDVTHQNQQALEANRQSMPPHLNGGSDPSLAPAIMGHSMRVPLPPRPGSVPASHGPVVPAPGPQLDKPIKLDNPDSPVEENSDWPDDEETSLSRLGASPAVAGLSSGLCYDVQMRYHCEVRPTADVHPEDPRRIYYIYKELCRAGLVDDPESSKPLVSRPLKRINARNATEAEVSLVHTPDHFAFVESTKGMLFRSGEVRGLIVYRYVG